MNIIILVIIYYIIGSIPTGYLISRLKGIDIQKKGSGNTGGTNVGRALGLKYGVLVVVLDTLKGYLPLLFIHNYYSDQIIFILGLAIIFGHIFSLFLHFKGGKGIGPMIGLAFILLPLLYILAFIIVWFLLIKVTNYMSLSNLLIIWGFPLYFVAFNRNISLLCLSLLLVGFLYYTHRENIKRLLAGTENRLGKH